MPAAKAQTNTDEYCSNRDEAVGVRRLSCGIPGYGQIWDWNDLGHRHERVAIPYARLVDGSAEDGDPSGSDWFAMVGNALYKGSFALATDPNRQHRLASPIHFVSVMPRILAVPHHGIAAPKRGLALDAVLRQP